MHKYQNCENISKIAMTKFSIKAGEIGNFLCQMAGAELCFAQLSCNNICIEGVQNLRGPDFELVCYPPIPKEPF